MAYLLDTSITSIMDTRRGLLSAEFDAWLTVKGPRLYMSAVTVFEGRQGTERLRLAGEIERAAALEAWLAKLIEGFEDRILSFDEQVALAAGEISARAKAEGKHPGLADVFIAATGQAHGMLVLTRNIRHFEALHIEAVDPTVSLPR